jgi:hypothetical protein
MDASAYALAHGIRRTRGTLEAWNRRPGPVLIGWFVGSLVAASALLLAVWVVAIVAPDHGIVALRRPPLAVGGPGDVMRIIAHNGLVLALHAMACVAGFIAGSSLPLQAPQREGLMRAIHEHGGRVAIAFVASATAFSLSAQAYVLGESVSRVASALGASPGLLLATLLPHALPELVALFLPLAAWLIASRRGEWDQLLAATLVTVALAIPILILSAVWEVYIAPGLLSSVIGGVR